MKAKVYQYGAYPRNNQVVVHTIDIEQLAGDVYCYLIEKAVTEPENDRLGVVLHIGENYFEFGHCSRRSISIPENMERAKSIATDYEAFVNAEMQNNQPVSVMYMKVYETLGMDTTPLIRYREQREAARIAETGARKQKEEQKRAGVIEQEKQRLMKIRQDYLVGNAIKGEDFVSICREDGFNIHIRTVGTLNNSVSSLNKSGSLRLWVQKGKARPKTDGVRKLIKEYNSFLSKDGQETKI